MNLTDEKARSSTLSRLKRIEGQVRGVQNMIDEGRDCREILQQLSAVKSAVQGAMLVVLESYISDCLLEQCGGEDRGKREALTAELIKVLEKAP